jgi:hypothetical protein
MLLVTSNAQGELDPLEVGLHAYRTVGKAQGKAGKGLKQNAELIGKTKQCISQLVSAAEVAESIDLSSQLDKLLGKSQHLAAIDATDSRAGRYSLSTRSTNDGSGRGS